MAVRVASWLRSSVNWEEEREFIRVDSLMGASACHRFRPICMACWRIVLANKSSSRSLAQLNAKVGEFWFATLVLTNAIIMATGKGN